MDTVQILGSKSSFADLYDHAQLDDRHSSNVMIEGKLDAKQTLGQFMPYSLASYTAGKSSTLRGSRMYYRF